MGIIEMDTVLYFYLYLAYFLSLPSHSPKHSSTTTVDGLFPGRFIHIHIHVNSPVWGGTFGADSQVQHLPLEEDERVTPGDMAEARQRVAEGKIRVADETIQMAYSAWLGCVPFLFVLLTS